MKYGQTSIVNFLSRLIMSLSGFVATIILTRTLGQDQYGTYVVILSVLAWAGMIGQLGLLQAVKKRVSESNDGNYVVSGATIQFVLYLLLAIILWISRSTLNEFIGIDVTLIIILMLAIRLGLMFTQTVLEGQHLVHVSSILTPVEWVSRSLIQIVLVVSGFGIVGALAGYVVGAFVAAVIGIHFITVPSKPPSKEDFVQLKSYAQFSWLNSIKGRVFQSMDTLILAIFIPHGLIAVYEIAWNLASLFAIFGASISRTLFPEMSKIHSEEQSNAEIASLLRVSLVYSGLFIIPGFVGAALVGDVVLTIYGSEFQMGYYILLFLTFARLLYGYGRQFVNTIDAIDRPDLTFYINAVFVGVNLSLNVLLTWQFGWYGAAVATTFSCGIVLILGYYYADKVVDINIPFREIGRQIISSGVMAVVVLIGRSLLGESLSVIILLIGLGASVYFSVLLYMSEEFRSTVSDNIPFKTNQ
ncbi:oligosaccharide flippase family protein [Halorubrum halophilum]|uniref:oligosaccharide flippase family protein n=1 Tax=Halorubrum halophilum TaxID=413816 RepID=UPI0009E5D346|nr:polysaccharide biosynthesis C-terminal domain-containing protein [Halorubrum halophilum]